MFKKRQWYLSMLTEISSWPWTKFSEMIDAIRTDTMSLKGPKSLMRNSETSRNLRGPEWLQKKLSVSDSTQEVLPRRPIHRDPPTTWDVQTFNHRNWAL